MIRRVIMTFSEARNDKEKLKQAIKEKWQTLLETDDDISDEISFFDIGGNSLTAGIVFSEIESQLGVKIPISDAYDYESIELLANHIIELM